MKTSFPDVAILLDHFGSGGVERVACHLANSLHRAGFQVELVVLKDAGPVRDLLDGGVSVHVLKTLRVLGRGGRLVAAIPDLARYLHARKPRLFHSPGNHTHIAAAAAVRLARYSGLFIPKITNPILKRGMSPWKRQLRRRVYAYAFAPASRIIVLSQAGVDRVAAIDANLAPKATFLHNPYVSETMIGCDGVQVRPQPPLILSVGRLSRQKDHATLLRAAALLQDQPWRLRICGTGPKAAELAELAENLGIAGRVEFAGFIDDIVPHYAEATVMVLSSRWEDLPATMIEAMACGCPLVTTASSEAVEDFIANVGGHPPVLIADPAALSIAIAKGLQGQLPQVSRGAMLAHGVETACAAHAALFSNLMAETADAEPRAGIPAAPVSAASIGQIV